MDLYVLVDDKLNRSQPYAVAAEKISHRLCEQDTASRSVELIIPLYSVLVRPHLEHSSSFGDPVQKTDKVKRDLCRVTWLFKGMELKMIEERLIELCLLNLEKKG